MRSQTNLEVLSGRLVWKLAEHLSDELVNDCLEDNFIHDNLRFEEFRVKLIFLAPFPGYFGLHIQKYSGKICQEEYGLAYVLVGNQNTTIHLWLDDSVEYVSFLYVAATTVQTTEQDKRADTDPLLILTQAISFCLTLLLSFLKENLSGCLFDWELAEEVCLVSCL